MPTPVPASGVCPLGTIPIVGTDGTVRCWDPNEVGFPGIPGTGQKPEPNPSHPAGGAQPPASPIGRSIPSGGTPPALPPRPPTLPVFPRQPGAPSVPYSPPGRITLWPGPIFQPSAPIAPVVSTSSGTSLGGALASEGPIFVNVTNTTNLADNSAANAVQSVSDAINGAIGAAVNQASQVAYQTQLDISNALLGTSNNITNGVNAVFSSLASAIQGIESGVGTALGGIGDTIGSDIAQSLFPVSRVLEALIIQITQQIGGLSGQIAAGVALIIPEIVKAISDPIGAVKDVLIGIENDISGNLRSLVQIPGAIASASTSLDASLQRVWTEYASFTESQTGWGTGEDAHKDISTLGTKIADALAGITLRVKGLNPKLSDRLTTLCKGIDLDKKLNQQVWEYTPELMGDVLNWHKFTADLIIWVFSVLPAVQKLTEEARQRMDKDCPIDLLPPGALVDAWMRGYITEQDAIDEAGKGNLSESRLHLLRDLATHQMAPGQLVEALYRGIISNGDFFQALQSQGWTGSQQELLKALGVSLLSVSEGLELVRRGDIDQQSLDSILKSHAYDDVQRKALASLAFRPPHTADAVQGEASLHALQALQSGPETFNVPEFYEKAGAAEGLDHDATVNRWLSHWNTSTFALRPWIELYFRRQISLETLTAIADSEMMPRSAIVPAIEQARPLIQFRTIETMLRLNLITDDVATELLRDHGYTDGHIKFLIAYAHRPGPAHAPRNAQALHSTSLGIAKEEYIDGSISADQYLAILTQHGYTVDGANTELQVVNAHQALLRRKEQAQLVIDEFGAGLIDEQGALAQLAVLGLTVDELARAAHKIRAFRSKIAKHPSEADLHHFLSLNIITDDEYVAELRLQGYSKKWAEAFLAWRTQPAASATAGLQPSAPLPTGP